jgi:hypothetical protein
LIKNKGKKPEQKYTTHYNNTLLAKIKNHDINRLKQESEGEINFKTEKGNLHFILVGAPYSPKKPNFRIPSPKATPIDKNSIPKSPKINQSDHLIKLMKNYSNHKIGVDIIPVTNNDMDEIFRIIYSKNTFTELLKKEKFISTFFAMFNSFLIRCPKYKSNLNLNYISM